MPRLRQAGDWPSLSQRTMGPSSQGPRHRPEPFRGLLRTEELVQSNHLRLQDSGDGRFRPSCAQEHRDAPVAQRAWDAAPRQRLRARCRRHGLKTPAIPTLAPG